MAEDEAGDFELLDRWCAGDKAAGTQLFRRYYRGIYRFFETKVESDVDVLVQETFLTCTRKRDQFRREGSFRAFLFAIARLALYEHWRRARGRGAMIDFDEISIASLSTTVGTRLVRHDDLARLLGVMRELPVEQQLLLELHYWEQLDGKDLAAVFGVEPATIRSRLFRAREDLRARLQAAGGSTARSAKSTDFDAWARGLREHADTGHVDDE